LWYCKSVQIIRSLDYCRFRLPRLHNIIVAMFSVLNIVQNTASVYMSYVKLKKILVLNCLLFIVMLSKIVWNI
jgi:hypothetical protein